MRAKISEKTLKEGAVASYNTVESHSIGFDKIILMAVMSCTTMHTGKREREREREKKNWRRVNVSG